jgi:hypothetical protein
VYVQAGTYNNRFELTFVSNLSTNPSTAPANIVIFHQVNTHTLEVTNPNAIALSSFALYDLSGKQLLYQDQMGDARSYEFSTANLAHGLYIAKLITRENEQVVQKIIVE